MPRLTKAEKEAAAAAAAEAAAAAGETPPAAPTAPSTTTRKRRSSGGALEGHPLGVMIGVGAEATTIEGVDYVVDPETGRVTGTA